MITYFRLIKYFFIIFLLLIIFFISIFYFFDKKIQNYIYPNVYINNKDFSLKTKKEIIDYFDKENNRLRKVNFKIFFKKIPVATISGSMINLHYDNQLIAEKAYLIGRSKNIWLAYYQKILTLFFKKKINIETSLFFNRSKIKEITMVLEENYNKPARDALFKFENGRVVSFRQEEKGEVILIEDFYNEFDKKIKDLETIYINPVLITIKSKVIEPKITLLMANNYGISELIAEAKSDFSHSIFERIYNIKLAISKLNGLLILKDKIFSFNEAIGDVSSLTGYKQAYIIKDGKTILGDGGGICQVSTTLFRAALKAGLEIIERHAHAYRVSYYENDSLPGFDATVFAPNVDLKIKNNTPAAILIQTEIDEINNFLYFRLYGKKDNRKIEIGKPVIWDILPPLESRYQEDPNLKKGIVKQIDFPAWGAKVKFKYRVYIDNHLLIDKDFYSYYRPWQAVYLVGTAD